jgi:predicted dehydrogenase
MLRMGIVGAENSHTVAVATLLNVDRAVEGMAVTHLWGETRALARAAAEAGRIPTIARDPREMIGHVDCVMIDHRHGKYHLPAATPFVEAGIPCFVDKPLCTSLAEARRFLALRCARGVAVTSFSTLPLQPCVGEIRRGIAELGEVGAAYLTGPGASRGKYGGVFFYGVHAVELMVTFFGAGVTAVAASRNGPACTLVCHYPGELTVTIALRPAGLPGWTVTAVGAGGTLHAPVPMDASPYLPGVRCIARMFQTGEEPFDDARLLAPVAILEAAQRAFARKGAVKVPPLG